MKNSSTIAALIFLSILITYDCAETFYEYKAVKKRDPFAPLVVKEAPKEVKKEDVRPKRGALPLESYDVSTFKLIGILWNKIGYYAVVVLPDGKSYNIKEGTKLGLHDGKVFKIAKDSVIIREQKRDYKGVLIPKDTMLKLREEER